MGGPISLDIRGGPAARLALVRSRMADLRARREAFERGVEERRALLEEEERLLRAEEAEAEVDLMRQRRDLLARVAPFLKAEGEDISALEGVEKDEERWQVLLARIKRMHRQEERRPLVTAEEIRRILP